MLHTRFKTSSNIILKILLTEQYILRNATNRREPQKYIQKIFRLTINVNLNNVKNQFNIIYNDIDSFLKKNDIKRSKKEITINEMLKNLNDCKQN